MSAALAPADRERLARLLGMIGSAHDGEALNAARLADRLIRDRELTWFDVVTSAADHRPQRGPKPPQDWRKMASACSRYPHLINRWEHEFLTGLPQFPRLSFKQHDCLRKIAVRLQSCGCSL
jgi:hypothetical protein